MQPIDRLTRTIARTPDALAIGGTDPLTYRELGLAVDALAVGFQHLDPAPGSRVGICAWNTVEHLIALLASYRAGKMWVPLSPRNGRNELDRMVSATTPAIIVADESCLDRFTPTGSPIVVAKEQRASTALSVRSLIASNSGMVPEHMERAADDPQIIKFSGGSTGSPRSVIQPVRSLEAQAQGIGAFFEFDSDDVNLIAAPLTHGASCFVLPILEAGGRHILLEKFDSQSILEVIEREGVTTIYAPPTMLYGMLGAVQDGQRFPSLRHVIYSAAPMSAARIRECQRVFGPVIETAYGQVEAPQIISAMRAHELMHEENLASVGKPSSVVEVRIDSSSAHTAAPGATGEILVRGPLVMSGYLGDPEQTSQTLIDGWLHTGDHGDIDARGYLYIRGRLKETINTGGFKVLPLEIEAVLGTHPAVRECAVFGLADEKWGEAVTAAVVLVPGSQVDAVELIAFVKAELGSVKAPKTIRLFDELPRNAAGKVSKADLRGMM